MFDDEEAGSSGRVINSPNKLRLHSKADLKSETIAFLPNGSTFEIMDIDGKFYHVQAPGVPSGYVWRERSSDARKEFYVELVPQMPPPKLQPPLDWSKVWTVVGIVVVGLAGAYACTMAV